jgi:ubiquinone/menaquinone biosynthesis C-methylase UbiE
VSQRGDVWQHFDRAAASYDQVSVLQQQSADWLLSHVPPLDADQVWMDAGCGTGRLARALASQGVRVWAVDQALSMLLPMRQVDGIQIICTDLRDLPMPEAMLDGWVSNFALHWLGSAFLPELIKLLRPAGQAWCAVPVAGSFSDLQQRFRGFPTFAFESAQTWQQVAAPWLQSAQLREFRQEFPHLRALLHSLRAMGGNQTADAHYQPDPVRLRQWLRDERPIALNYQVLLMQLQAPAAQDDFHQMLARLQADPRFEG